MKARSILACAVAALLTTGCATIVSKSTQTMTLTSVPDGATVRITNRSGVAVNSSSTPSTVTLKKGRGYFKPETYTLSFSKEGYKPVDITVRGSVNGWYFGNVIFGGLIGLLAVDPATGAMYTLQPKEVAATLDALKVARDGREQTLTVLLVKEVPKEYVGQLVPIAAD